jgi:hypothetical protein
MAGLWNLIGATRRNSPISIAGFERMEMEAAAVAAA